jgi:hypothetical protein
MFKLKTVDMLMMTYGIRELCPFISPLFRARGIETDHWSFDQECRGSFIQYYLHRLGGIEWHEKKNRLFQDYNEQ